MTRQKKIVCLASGSGSLFEFLATQFGLCEVPIEVVALLTDVADCGAVQKADRHNISVHTFESWQNPEETCLAMSVTLENLQPDLVIGVGFMKILTKTFIHRWHPINTHPSLLPAFKGAHAVRDSMNYNSFVTGTSVHRMAEEVDQGSLLTQSPCICFSNEPEENLHARIKLIEKAQLFHTIISLLSHKGPSHV